MPVKSESEAYAVCAELREVLARHGVTLPALMPLTELNLSPTPTEGDAGTPAIWLGCCRTPTARRLIELLRQVPPPPPRDLRAAVREANEDSERSARLRQETGWAGG